MMELLHHRNEVIQ